MEINPTVPQDSFIFSESRYPAFVGGFGSGKTEALIVRSIINKILYPQNDRAFYEPTYDLIRMIAWPRFEELLSNLNIPYRLTKHPHNVLEVEGRGKIIFRSMDTPNRIIGYEVADSDADEIDTLKPPVATEVWRRILSRNRQKKHDGKPNTIGVATTPEGFGFVYKTWEIDKPPGYEIIRAPSHSNPHLPEGYLDSLRDIYPEELLQAYIEGLFVNLKAGTVYNAYDRVKCRSEESIREKEPLRVGMDFNVTNMSAVVYVLRDKAWHAVEELKGIYDTPSMIDTLKAKYPQHNIRVYPDASGKSRKSVDASKSDISLLESAGYMCLYKSANPIVKNRVMSANKAFQDGLLKVNDKACPEYARCLEQLAYDDNGEPDKKSNLDHLPDAGTYPIAFELPVVKPALDIYVR